MIIPVGLLFISYTGLMGFENKIKKILKGNCGVRDKEEPGFKRSVSQRS